jgi:hypothetical protein
MCGQQAVSPSHLFYYMNGLPELLGKICPVHLNGPSVLVTKFTFPNQTHVTCISINLIYILTCTNCDAFYVGKNKNNCPLE